MYDRSQCAPPTKRELWTRLKFGHSLLLVLPRFSLYTWCVTATLAQSRAINTSIHHAANIFWQKQIQTRYRVHPRVRAKTGNLEHRGLAVDHLKICCARSRFDYVLNQATLSGAEYSQHTTKHSTRENVPPHIDHRLFVQQRISHRRTSHTPNFLDTL